MEHIRRLKLWDTDVELHSLAWMSCWLHLVNAAEIEKECFLPAWIIKMESTTGVLCLYRSCMYHDLPNRDCSEPTEVADRITIYVAKMAR